MELRDALTQIASIRASVAATETFRGYRALPVAFSGVLAFLAAAIQPFVVPNPGADLTGYLMLWIATALIGLGAAAVRIVYSDWHSPHPLTRETTRLAVGQFLPCLVAGLLVTIALVRHVPHVAWLLPGLWQVLFAMGIFASSRLLPSALFWVGVFYLVCGCLNLSFTHESGEYNRWSMGLPFGIGQMATAAILYWNLEREGHGQGE